MNSNKIKCELASIVYDKYTKDAYGLRHCKTEYLEEDVLEHVLNLYILETGHDCNHYKELKINQQCQTLVIAQIAAKK
jgi:hypothetical protein